MAKTYAAISSQKLNNEVEYHHTGQLPELVHLDDSALDAMVDFTKVRAMTIHRDSPLKHARLEMQACSVHMLLVTNDAKQIIGIISSEDILGEKPIKVTQESSITRDEIKVHMIMLPLSQVLALPYHEASKEKIGNVIQSMKDHRQHYALVVENGGDKPQFVRGIFSLSNIGRQLHVNLIDADLMATSLADLQDKIDNR